MNLPTGERKRITYITVDTITRICTNYMVRLPIAIRAAFGYCVCCKKAITLPRKDDSGKAS